MAQQFINQDVHDEYYNNRYIVLKNYILYNLGHPLIRIELTQEHLLTAIIDAVTMYQRYAAIDFDFMAISTSENPFDIPYGINKETIVDVIFSAGFFDSIGAGLVTGGFVGEFEGSIIPIFGQKSGLLDVLGKFNLATYYTYLQKLEDIKKVIGLDRMWQVVNNQIEVYPKTSTFTDIGILYRGKLTDSEVEEQEWIKKYALARAKMMLGTVRSKFSGINAAGMNIAADGEALKSEAKEEIDKLEERLWGMQRPMPILQC